MESALQHQVTRWRVAAAVLADPDQRRLQFAVFGSAVVEHATWVAILVYGYRIGGATAAGLVAVAQLVPSAILTPLAAGRFERMSRHSALVGGYGMQAAFIGLVWVFLWLGAHPVAVVALMTGYSVFLGVAGSVHGAAIPELSDSPQSAIAANAVTAIAQGIGVFVGPLVGGLLLLVGLEEVFLVMALTMVGSTVAALRVRGGRSVPGYVHERDDGGGGIIDLARSREVRVLLVLGGIGMIVVGALDVLLVVLAVDVLDIGEAGTGYLQSLVGIGSLVGGAVAIGLVGRARLARALGMGAAAMGAPLMAIAAIPGASLLLPSTGFGQTYGDVAARTLLQRIVVRDRLVRAFGLLESTAMVGLAAGALIAPVLIGSIGAEAAFLVVGALVPAGFVAASARLRKADRQARVPTEAIATLLSVDVFTVLEPPSLEALALDAEVVEAPAGETVLKRGDRGDRAFVVMDGRFQVMSQSGRPIAELGHGEIFGEIALLADVPRTATVVASEPGRLLALHRESFLDVVSQGSAAHGALSEMANRRLDELSEAGD